MTMAQLSRRTILQSGAVLAGPMALAGILPSPLQAASPQAAAEPDTPISGAIAGWAVVKPDQGVQVRVIQLDGLSRPVRQVAAADLGLAKSGASLQQVCGGAQDFVRRVVARSWGVPAAECVVGSSRIAHEGLGHAVGYTLWVDVI